MLQNPEIKKLILRLWNIFWSGGISNPLTAIEQITYLIFIKRLDILDDEKKENDKNYISIFDGTYKKIIKVKNEKTGKEEDKEVEVSKEELRWSKILEIKDKEERLQHISKNVFQEIKKLEDENSHFTKHMINAVFIIPSASLLFDVMDIIEKIFEKINEDRHAHQDIQGDVYEYLLNEIATAGKNGQFRTPRHIINLLVELVNPQENDKIIDPACGSAGFLLGAYQYILTTLDKDGKYSDTDDDGFTRSTQAILTENQRKKLSQNLKGFDIDLTMVRLGLMNLIMHGIDNPNVDYIDTLSKSFKKYSDELGSYDIVLANPPFTGNLNKGELDDTLTLSEKTTKTELLFIDRIYSMLKDGGTAGVIIPQGVLFGSSTAFIETRKLMIENSQLKAVISMPSGIFKPYAGVATAILIFTKAKTTDKVFFYDMEHDGRELDDKRTKKFKKNGEPNYGDLQDIIQKYRNQDDIENDKKAKYFLVDKEKIIKKDYDLSFNTYHELTYTESDYGEPSNILNQLDTLEESIISELADLRKYL